MTVSYKAPRVLREVRQFENRSSSLPELLAALDGHLEEPEPLNGGEHMQLTRALNDGAYTLALRHASRAGRGAGAKVRETFERAREKLKDQRSRPSGLLGIITGYQDVRTSLNELNRWASSGGEPLNHNGYLEAQRALSNGFAGNLVQGSKEDGLGSRVAYDVLNMTGHALRENRNTYLANNGESELEIIFKAAYESGADASLIIDSLNAWAEKGGETFTKEQYVRLRNYTDKVDRSKTDVKTMLFNLATEQGLESSKVRDALEYVGSVTLDRKNKGLLTYDPQTKTPENFLGKLGRGIKTGFRSLYQRYATKNK